MTFASNVQKFVIKSKIRGDLVLRKLAFDALAGVIRMSPVRTGRFRGNWNLALHRPNLSVNMDLKDKQGGMTETKGQAKVSQADVGMSIFITNNVPYAHALEQGSSKQARMGVLRPTVERIKSGLKEIIGRLG